jgi:hypothetical protein
VIGTADEPGVAGLPRIEEGMSPMAADVGESVNPAIGVTGEQKRLRAVIYRPDLPRSEKIVDPAQAHPSTAKDVLDLPAGHFRVSIGGGGKGAALPEGEEDLIEITRRDRCRRWHGGRHPGFSSPRQHQLSNRGVLPVRSDSSLVN